MCAVHNLGEYPAGNPVRPPNSHAHRTKSDFQPSIVRRRMSNTLISCKLIVNSILYCSRCVNDTDGCDRQWSPFASRYRVKREKECWVLLKISQNLADRLKMVFVKKRSARSSVPTFSSLPACSAPAFFCENISHLNCTVLLQNVCVGTVSHAEFIIFLHNIVTPIGISFSTCFSFLLFTNPSIKIIHVMLLKLVILIHPALPAKLVR